MKKVYKPLKVFIRFLFVSSINFSCECVLFIIIPPKPPKVCAKNVNSENNKEDTFKSKLHGFPVMRGTGSFKREVLFLLESVVIYSYILVHQI